MSVHPFDLPPEEAIRFLAGKGLRTTWRWDEMKGPEHDADFTVAKMLDLDLLRDVHQAVTAAIEDGTTERDFRDRLEPLLVAKGWWGKEETTDAGGNVSEVQLGSPRRLRTIFRTNMATAYAAGRWAQIQQAKEIAPHLMYDAVDDDRTRPEHANWDGVVLPVDDPWWKTHYPPNGFNCRCSVIQLTPGMLEDLGKAGPDAAPSDPAERHVDPVTNEDFWTPGGVDPGWDYAPGASAAERIGETLVEKIESAPPELGAAAGEDVPETVERQHDKEFETWADDLVSGARAPTGERRVVGILAPDIVDELKAREVPVTTAALTITDRVVAHMAREAKSARGQALSENEIKRLPASVRNAKAVLWDRRNPALIYAFDLEDDEELGKVVVRVEFEEFVRGPDRIKRKSVTNAVRTGGRVRLLNLDTPQDYDLLKGKLR